MKNVKAILTSLTFAIALTGVFVAKANEKKRTTSATGYVQSGSSFYSITLQGTDFNTSGASTSNQAILVNGDPTVITGGKAVFIDQLLSSPVRQVIP